MTQIKPGTDYYSLLKITPAATPMDIVNAYRQAKLAYQPESLATYSLFSDDELDAAREMIDQAYQALSDPESRREYDLQLSSGLPVEPEKPGNIISLHDSNHEMEQDVNDDSRHLSMSGIEDEIEINDNFSGGQLKKLREAHGISLEAIAEHTKISKQYLLAIENEDSASFPETVYLKGYLKQYAAEIGLDATQVVEGYRPLNTDKLNKNP